MRKYECKSEIYMTTNLTVATASGKRRVAFCNLFFSETNTPIVMEPRVVAWGCDGVHEAELVV